MNNQKNTYKILMDERWSLSELTEFTNLYYQNYNFVYWLDGDTNIDAHNKINKILEEYELRSGSTYVNIYSIFRYYLPQPDRPKIKSIAYASPGWIELVLNKDAAIEIAKAVSIFLGASTMVVTAYKKLSEIYRDLAKKRKKQKNALIRLDREQITEVQKLTQELAKGLGFRSLKALDEHTKNPEESSKLLMAHYRRVKKMSAFVEDGKVSFPIEGD